MKVRTIEQVFIIFNSPKEDTKAKEKVAELESKGFKTHEFFFPTTPGEQGFAELKKENLVND